MLTCQRLFGLSSSFTARRRAFTSLAYHPNRSISIVPSSLRDDNAKEQEKKQRQRYASHSIIVSHSMLQPQQHQQSKRFMSVTVDHDNKKSEKKKSSSKLGNRAREGARRGAKTAKEMLQKYGVVFVGTYASLYLTTWATLAAGIHSGLLDPVQIMSWLSLPPLEDAAGGIVEDAMSTTTTTPKSSVTLLVEWMQHFSWMEPLVSAVEANPLLGNIGVAWVATKFTEPFRLMITLGIVPRLARTFGYVVPDEDDHEDDDHHDEIETHVDDGGAAVSTKDEVSTTTTPEKVTDDKIPGKKD